MNMTWRSPVAVLVVIVVGLFGLQTSEATASGPSHGPVSGVRTGCGHRSSRSATSGCVTTVRPTSPTMVAAGQRKVPTGTSASTTRSRTFSAAATVDVGTAIVAPRAVPAANWTRGPPSP